MLEQAGQAKSLTGQVLMRDLATALDGHGGIKNITLNSDYTLTFTLADDTEVTTTSVRGATGAKGDKGTDGRAITSVTKTGTSGLVDTYKIQFSDNTNTTFTVSNGSSIKSIAKTSTSGLVDTYTVTLTDNTTATFTVTNGNGIASITLQSGTHTAGTTDVYKITYDDGQYTTFSVYNGMNGLGAVDTVNDKAPDGEGNVNITGEDILVSASDSTTIKSIVDTIKSDVSEIESSLSDAQGDISTLETGKEPVKFLFSSTAVSASAFVADTTYADYPYRASVALTSVLASMVPEVILSLSDATSGNYAPVSACYNGGVYLYAAAVPEEDLTIPTILIWRGA